MGVDQKTFPRAQQLWHGAILSTIAHAIWITAHSLLSYELSWDGPNYNRQDSQGTRGTITFVRRRLVGMFRDDHSPRVPWHSQAKFDHSQLLAGIPKALQSIAHEQTFQYLFDTHDGIERPIITAAFWSDGEYLTAAEPWSDVLTHGAHLVRIELMETEAAIIALQAEYEFGDSQVALLRSLSNRKMAHPDRVVTLEPWELDKLTAQGMDGYTESREMLAAIGITVSESLQ